MAFFRALLLFVLHTRASQMKLMVTRSHLVPLGVRRVTTAHSGRLGKMRKGGERRLDHRK